MTFRFIEPAECYARSFVNALCEGLFPQQWPESEINEVEMDFTAWRRKVQDPTEPVVLPDGSKAPRVPQTTRWLMRAERFVGLCGVRHFLTESLKTSSGHIGYAMRPSERQKGIGRLLLLEGLRTATEFGLSEVIVTCDADNRASIRIIESCGGDLVHIVNLSFRDVPHNIYRIVIPDGGPVCS